MWGGGLRLNPAHHKIQQTKTKEDRSKPDSTKNITPTHPNTIRIALGCSKRVELDQKIDKFQNGLTSIHHKNFRNRQPCICLTNLRPTQCSPFNFLDKNKNHHKNRKIDFQNSQSTGLRFCDWFDWDPSQKFPHPYLYLTNL